MRPDREPVTAHVTRDTPRDKQRESQRPDQTRPEDLSITYPYPQPADNGTRGRRMLTRDQADRIATAIQVVRPEWNHPQIMGVLHKDEIRERRTYADTFHAMLAIALDPDTRQPTRVLEPGPWWNARPAADRGTTHALRTPADDDCRECGQPAEHPSHFDKSEWGCDYLSHSAWAERARAADHHKLAAALRQQLKEKQ